MTAVPSTPTAADRNLEKKKLEDEIAVLKQKREIEEREFKQWAEANTAIQAKFGELANLDQSKDEIRKTLVTSLLVQKDAVVKDINEHVAKQDAARALKIQLESENKKLKTDNEAKDKRIVELDRLIAEKESWFATTHDKNTKEITAEEVVLSGMRKERDAAIADRDNATEEARLKREFMLKEEARLALSARDLAVWEGRIRKWFAEMYPGQEFVL